MPMHPLGLLITRRMDLLQPRWVYMDVSKRMRAAGHRGVSKSRVGQLCNDPVASIKGEVIFALAAGLGVTALTVANAALESMGIQTRPMEVTDSVATILIDPTLSDSDRRRLVVLIEEMRQDGKPGPRSSHDAEASLPGLERHLSPGQVKYGDRRGKQSG